MCECVYKHGHTCGYDAFSLELPGVLMMRMQSVSGAGRRAIVDFISEADMYLDFAKLHPEPGICRF